VVVAPGVDATPGVVAAGAVEVGAGDRLRALQHLQRLRALEGEQSEQEDGAADRDLLLLAAFAFSGSTRFAITRSPRFLLPRCRPAAPPSSSRAASRPAAGRRRLRR
jgi:hypothetical protein